MTPSVELAEFLEVEGGIHDAHLIDSFHIPLIKLRRAKKSGVRPIAAHPVYMVRKELSASSGAESHPQNKTLSQLSPTDLISEETYLLPPTNSSGGSRFSPKRLTISPQFPVTNLVVSPNQLFKPRIWTGPQLPFHHLRKLTYEGAVERYGRLNEAIVSRIEKELTIIEAKSFSEYFLTVSFIVKQSSSHCGRRDSLPPASSPIV